VKENWFLFSPVAGALYQDRPVRQGAIFAAIFSRDPALMNLRLMQSPGAGFCRVAACR